MKPVGRASYWEERYAAAEDGWELGGASPPLVAPFRPAPFPR